MRVGRAAFLAVLAIAAVLVSPIAGGAQSDGFRPVQDPRDRFTIGIPATWEVRTSTGDPAVEATSPAPAGELPDSLDVIVRDLPWPISPEACVQRAEQVMRLLGTGYTTVDKHPDEIGGLQAYSHAYTWRTRAGVVRRSYQVCATLSRRAFILIGSTTDTPARVRERMPTLERIMDTFRPKGAPPAAPEHSRPEPGQWGNR